MNKKESVGAARCRLPGNTLDCDTGHWVRLDSGVGAGADSYYEYLLKVGFSTSALNCALTVLAAT